MSRDASRGRIMIGSECSSMNEAHCCLSMRDNSTSVVRFTAMSGPRRSENRRSCFPRELSSTLGLRRKTRANEFNAFASSCVFKSLPPCV